MLPLLTRTEIIECIWVPFKQWDIVEESPIPVDICKQKKVRTVRIRSELCMIPETETLTHHRLHNPIHKSQLMDIECCTYHWSGHWYHT